MHLSSLWLGRHLCQLPKPLFKAVFIQYVSGLESYIALYESGALKGSLFFDCRSERIQRRKGSELFLALCTPLYPM